MGSVDQRCARSREELQYRGLSRNVEVWLVGDRRRAFISLDLGVPAGVPVEPLPAYCMARGGGFNVQYGTSTTENYYTGLKRRAKKHFYGPRSGPLEF